VTNKLYFEEAEMNENITSPKETDHTRAVIIATTIVLMTCILSCAAVLIFLIMKIA
jgi:hypothetical protein